MNFSLPHRVDEISYLLSCERQDEEPQKRELLFVPEITETDRHPFMPCRWLVLIGAHDAVPPGQVEAEVGVCLTDDDGVMHAVHIGGHKKYPEHPIHGAGDVDIAVGENRAAVQGHFEYQDRKRRGSQYDDGGHFDEHGENYFHGVETYPGRHVNVQVCMVYHVQAPAQGHSVKRDVLKIDYEIERDGTDNDGGPRRQVIEIDEPPTLLGGKNGHGYRDDREEPPDHDGV